MTGDDRPGWMVDAACAGMPTDAFFLERGDMAGTAAALAVCHGCPVTAECLAHALEHGEDGGVWGGTSARQRRPLQTRHNRLQRGAA